jgi:hypothetical protein
MLYLAGVGLARRVQMGTGSRGEMENDVLKPVVTEEHVPRESMADVVKMRANSKDSVSAIPVEPEVESLWESRDVQRVLMLCSIAAFGKLLQGRFTNQEANVVQKVILQFLVPTVLFTGLSKEVIKASHMSYIIAGVVLVLVRIVTSVITAYAVFGPSNETLRRTSAFMLPSIAAALSVLPFIAEFVGQEYVGFGGIVDLGMKVWMLLVMPLIVPVFADRSGDASNAPFTVVLVRALMGIITDPIPVAVMLGILTAILTNGGGVASLGFVGQAIVASSAGQTPLLFFLIGLKLKFDSASPLYCFVLLALNQGLLLILVYLTLLCVDPGPVVTKFMILFAHGAQSPVALNAIAGAVNAGVKGYSIEFSFDICAMAFMFASVLQCTAAVMGSSYNQASGPIGLMLITIAVVLRLLFAAKFKETYVEPADNGKK